MGLLYGPRLVSALCRNGRSRIAKRLTEVRIIGQVDRGHAS